MLTTCNLLADINYIFSNTSIYMPQSICQIAHMVEQICECMKDETVFVLHGIHTPVSDKKNSRK